MRISRKRERLPEALTKKYKRAKRKVARTIRMPVKYAGPGHWSVFPKPCRYSDFGGNVVGLPGTKPNEACLLIEGELWQSFRRLSLWVEALCIHEWSLFTERVEQIGEEEVDRGDVYRHLTDRPESRVALTWERNKIDLLLMEGQVFTCPWTGKAISSEDEYHLDHLLPISIYPINELWNLIPSNPVFNAHQKSGRLPSTERLKEAKQPLSQTYESYTQEPDLDDALLNDVSLRFADFDFAREGLPSRVADSAVRFIDRVAKSRNLDRF